MAPDGQGRNHRLAFVEHIKKEKKEGRKCDPDIPDHYVPPTATKDFWDLQKVREVMREVEAHQSYDTVRRDYVIVFSILVLVSSDQPDRIQMIESFMKYNISDKVLPLWEFPVKLEGIMSSESWIHFDKLQWMFCPLDLGATISSHREVHPKYILPITNSVLVSGKPSKAHVYKVEAQPESGLTGDKVSEHLVFKTYGSGRGDVDSYYREKKVLTWLQNCAGGNDDGYHQHIIRSFGSFLWEDKDGNHRHTVVFECAEKTLLDVFQEGHTPVEFKDIHTFWLSILDVLKGVHLIHDGITDSNERIGVHQDLKPENILVFSDEQSKIHTNGPDPFKIRVKIGDFGLSDVRDRRGPLTRDSRGTRTYSPPELMHNLHMPCAATPQSDVWAISCILIEVAVWIMGGEDQRKKFREARIQEAETALAYGIQDTGLGDCFHNGDGVLKCVKQVSERIEENGRRSDKITGPIATNIIKEVLDTAVNSRLDAGRLWHRLVNIIERGMKEPSAPQELPASVQTPQRPPNGYPPTPNTSDGMRRTTIPIDTFGTGFSPMEASPEELDQNSGNDPFGSGYLQLPNRDSVASPSRILSFRSGRPSSKPSGYSTMKDLRSLRSELKQTKQWPTELNDARRHLRGREIIMIFDDAKSMGRWRTTICEHGSNMVGLLKSIDSNGIDMHCTSSESHVSAASFTEAERFLKLSFSKDESEVCFMEHALTNVVDGIIRSWNHSPTRLFREKKKVSIFVFTDGIWDSTERVDAGVEKPIMNLVDTMKKHNLSHNHVGIQFIRYGDDPIGIKRLAYLDDCIARDNKNEDIVDHKSSQDDSVSSIFIGSLDKNNDTPAPVRQPITRNSTLRTTPSNYI